MTPISEAIQAELIAASRCAISGRLLHTVKLVYPRMVHADFMTHRLFSRNASSSRAMPSAKLLADAPYVPRFRANQPGMQPGDFLSDAAQAEAETLWLSAAEVCKTMCRVLSAKEGLNVHKQWANRMLEWFGYITVVVTSTDWINFLALRDHPDAQDEIQHQAQALKRVLEDARPVDLGPADWHLPFIGEEDVDEVHRLMHRRTTLPDVSAMIDFAFANLGSVSYEHRLLLAMSAARSARTSYRNFDGSKLTIEKDVQTFLKLVTSERVHASPLEHQARPAPVKVVRPSNLEGWDQFRKFVPGERAQAA